MSTIKSVVALFVVILMGILSTSAWAKSESYNGPVTVKVAVMNSTQVEFPEEVSSVVMGMPTDKISIEHSNNLIFIQPLASDLEGEIYAIGKSGRSYILSVTVVPKDSRDKQLRIISADQTQKERVEQLRYLTPLGLIKVMVLGQDLDGVSTEKKPIVVFNDSNLKIVAETIYDAVSIKGYIVTIENFSKTPFDFRTLNIKGLVAFSAYKGNYYMVFYE